MKQLTEEQAVQIYKAGDWRKWTPKQLVCFQMNQDRLCVPFHEFHSAVNDVFGRAVFTHEFADRKRLLEELEGVVAAPSMDEIMALLPQEKTVVVSS